MSIGKFNDAAAFYYSDGQADLIRKQGSDIGVLLVDGKAVLWTETKTNWRIDDPRMKQLFEQPKDQLASHWNDAVCLHRGSFEACQILVNGRGELTDGGRLFCTDNGLVQTATALRTAASKPTGPTVSSGAGLAFK